MKKTTVKIALIGIALWGVSCNKTPEKVKGADTDSTYIRILPVERPLRIVLLQDVTGSIAKNGVEIASPVILNPFFKDIRRPIEIYFGLISDQAYQKFVRITLSPAIFKPPVLPDIHALSPDEQIKAKNEYVSQRRSYEADSIQFYSDRNELIRRFISDCDSVLCIWKGQLALSTDLCTAVRIADRIFNYSIIDSARNVLLINSDGLDTKGNHIARLKNAVEVYLIGANDKDPTCIDSIVTRRFAFMEQTISFTLKKQ